MLPEENMSSSAEEHLVPLDKLANDDHLVSVVGENLISRTPGILDNIRLSSWAVLNWGKVTLFQFHWLFTSFMCLVLGYLLVWQRGLYLDDYPTWQETKEAIDGGVLGILHFPALFPSFPARIIAYFFNFAATFAIPYNELLNRAFVTFWIGLNAVLLGWLVYRLLNSWLAALISGWLLLMPFYSQEALLWAGSASYVFAGTLILLYLHLCLNVFSQTKRIGRNIVIANLFFFVMFFGGELTVTAAGAVLVFGPFIAVPRWNISYKMAFKRVSLLVGPSIIYVLIVYKLVYSQGELVSARGGLDLTPTGLLDRTIGFIKQANWLLLDDNWGKKLIGETFGLGLEVVLNSWKGLLLLILAIGLLIFTVVRWKSEQEEYQLPYRLGWLVAGVGVSWSLLQMLFPAILVPGQILEIRMLYLPTLWLGVALGALAWLFLKWVKRPILGRFIIALVGLGLILSTLCMVGYSQAYAARYRHDQQELAALVKAVPVYYPFPVNTNLVPYNLDERIFDRTDKPASTQLLFGMFEVVWATNTELKQTYNRADLKVIQANRWVPMHFSYIPEKSDQMIIQGNPVAIDRTLIFTYKDSTVYPINSLTIKASDGTARTFYFPIARDLQSKGTPTIENLVVTKL